MRYRVVRVVVVGLFLCAAAGLRPAAADRDALANGRKLVRSKSLGDRSRGVDLLAASNEAAAIQPLEDLIRTLGREMDKLAKVLDRIDLDYNEAMSYWHMARDSGDARFFRLANDYAELVAAQWGRQAAELVLMQDITIRAGEAFARFDDPAAIVAIGKGARTEPSPLVRQWYVHALASSRSPEAVPLLLDLLTHHNPLTRAAAVRALRGAVLRRSVFERLVALVQDDAWPVRLGAYQAIARAPLDRAAPVLLEALTRETGEMARAVDALLHSHVGVGFPDDPTQWTRFWSECGQTVLEGRFRPPAERRSEPTVETFFNLPIVSTNVLFLVDFSSSMDEDLEHTDPRNAEVRAEHRLPATRLGVAQAEVIRALRGLPESATFQLVIYSDKAERFRSSPSQATPSNRNSAITWLLRQKTGWMTNMWEGLKEAFGDIFGSGSAARRFRDLPDTIVFLTDGTPTRGRFQHRQALIDLVRLWNLSVGAVVLAVGVGDEQATDLLEAAARVSGGTYLDLRRRGAPPARERPGVPRSERLPAVPVLLAQARDALDGHDDDRARTTALATLARLVDWSPEARGLLVRQLGHRDSELRVKAAEHLGMVDPASIPDLLPDVLHHVAEGQEGLHRGTEPALRVLMTWGPAAAPATDLLVRLVASPTCIYRIEAAQALGAIGRDARDAIPTLREICPGANPDLRAAIEAALAEMGRR